MTLRLEAPSAVIRGVGVVSPGGSSLEDLWASVASGDGTHAEVVAFDGGPTVLACRAQGFDPSERFERHELRRLDRSHQMALWAAQDALAMAGETPDPDRCAIVVGLGFPAAEYGEAQHRAFHERGERGVSPAALPVIMPNSIAAHLSMRTGARGPVHTLSSACASGAAAIGEALWLLRTGRADRVLAGGVDALITPVVSAMFSRMEAMSRRFDRPAASSRPFDAGRDGFVLGEGAGFVVVERPTAEDSSGWGSLLGYGATSDAEHIVAPSPSGSGAIACMRDALADAGLDPGEIRHINAHGTSTPLNDAAEALAIAEVFGPHGPPVTSTKGVLGHLLGGAGAVEAIVAMMTARAGIVPPTANVETIDPEIADLIDLATAPRRVDPGPALSNSFGFGGHNVSLVVA